MSNEKKDKAVKVLPKFLEIIKSDLMKATHYMKQSISVAIVAENTELSEKLAAQYVELENVTANFILLVDKEHPHDTTA